MYDIDFITKNSIVIMPQWSQIRQDTFKRKILCKLIHLIDMKDF